MDYNIFAHAHMKLATKIILTLTAIGVFLMASSVFYLESSVKQSFKLEVIDNLRITSESIEGTYFAFINGLQKRAVDWSSDQYIRQFSETLVSPGLSSARREKIAEDFGAYVRNQKMPYDNSVLLVDLIGKDGVVIASTRKERVGTNELKEEEDNHAHFFSKALVSTKLGESFVRGFVYEEDESPEPMTHVAMRVFSAEKNAQGNFTPLPAVLLVHFLPAKDIQGILSGDFQVQEGALSGHALSKSFKTANVFLVNKDRKIVASARELPPELKDKAIVSKVVEDCLMRGVEASEERVDFEGANVILNSMCLQRDELVLIVEVGTDEAFTFLNDLVKKTYVGGLLVFIMVTSIILFSARGPLKNLSRIARIAEKISRGDFSERADVVSKDELGIFAKSFNAMLDALDFSRKEIQKADEKLKYEAAQLERDVEEHKKQEAFLEESKKAQLNLLEDSWKAKELLETESHRLQTVLSSIGEGLLLIDGQYHVALVNPTATHIFGLSASELLGKDLRAIVKLWKKRKDEVPPEKWPIEEMFITRKIVTVDLEDDFSLTTEKRPEHTPVVFSIAPLVGDSAGAVIVFRDVTKDRELDDAKSGFISVASHQLRTPLTSIRWYSEMLLSEDAGALNPAQRDFMKEIHGGAERLYQTVDLLLGLSRVESGKIKIEKINIDLGVFTAEVEKEMSALAEEKKVTMMVSPPSGESVHVLLDPLMLRQVVINLLSNAIRYSNDGGVVEIRWWAGENGEAGYAVRDTGIGIPESQRARIFSKFFRAENALQKAPDGSGLGLALVKELVEGWGGRVWFESIEGQGATFFFTIPKG